MDLVLQIEFQIELLSNFETNLGLFIKGRAFQGCRMEGVTCVTSKLVNFMLTYQEKVHVQQFALDHQVLTLRLEDVN